MHHIRYYFFQKYLNPLKLQFFTFTPWDHYCLNDPMEM